MIDRFINSTTESRDHQTNTQVDIKRLAHADQGCGLVFFNK
jgi:hypothetical protein